MSFIAVALLNIPFPWLVLGAGVTGWLGQRWAPAQFAGGGGHCAKGAAAAVRVTSLMDDDTPTPARTQFRKARLAKVLLVGALK